MPDGSIGVSFNSEFGYANHRPTLATGLNGDAVVANMRLGR